MAKTSKAPPANTAQSSTEALADVARGYPSPPSNLAAAELAYWHGILQVRLPQAWAAADLVHAANLARCFADVDKLRRRLAREGTVVKNPKSGATKLNPLLSLIDTLTNRSIALTRLLQLHAVARVGPARDQGTRKGEAMEANRALAGSPKQEEGFDPNDLLAKPGGTTH